jgi:hypothetical protein
MSTVLEIETAIAKLTAEEWRELRGWVLTRPESTTPIQPKTGAELARLWRSRFHLATHEADEWAAELENSRPPTRQAPPVWE